MAIRKILLLTGIFIALLSTAKSQSVINPLTIKDKMQWFSDARLDIFIHAGIYAVNGIDESWCFPNKTNKLCGLYEAIEGFYAEKL